MFAPATIPTETRDQLLDAARYAPSSFNSQPYRFYWVESAQHRPAVADICLGQSPAKTASALVVAIADIGSLEATSRGQLEWMRATPEFSEAKIRDYERRAKIGRILFMPGPLGIFAAIKWCVFRLANLWKPLGRPPLFRREILQWAMKSTALACENLMIAAEALGLNTCPMEGFDQRRLLKYLRLSPGRHEIVMVIAVGKKAPGYVDPPQWRRPLDETVTIL